MVRRTKSRKGTPGRSARPGGFRVYGLRHVKAALASFGQILDAPFASLMTIAVIGIALALPIGLFVLLKNVQFLGSGWGDSTQISLYLKQDVQPTQAEDLLRQLKQRPDVGDARYVSPAEGLATFKETSDLGKAIDHLQANPLPGVIILHPALAYRTPNAMAHLVENLKVFSQVDMAQLDMQWVQQLYRIIELCKHVISALAILLGLGVLLIIGNTIRLMTQNRHREIEVMKLVGATDAFVRRPFLYTGMFYGLLGSLIALFFVCVVLWWLEGSAQALAATYGSVFSTARFGCAYCGDGIMRWRVTWTFGRACGGYVAFAG